MGPLRVGISGCGMRSRTVWQRHVNESGRFELVGVQDVQQASLDKALEAGSINAEQAFLDLDALLETTRPDVLIVCPVHTAHAAAIDAGLSAGCHVLVEKPFTTSLDDAVRLTEVAEAAGLQLGVVQNWRTKSVGLALKRAVQDGVIGEVSHIFFRYLRDRELPHLPDYLFEERDPMLYALTVHHFDLFRYMLADEIATVEGHAFRPRWSRYEHTSLNQLWVETEGGVAISYVGTISSRNAHLPWENLVVEGELGSLFNDSNFSDPPLLLSRRGDEAPIDLTAEVTIRDGADQYVLADTTILQNFHDAVTSGEPLISSARENLGTLASVEAARIALTDGGVVTVSDLLERAGAVR